MFELLHNLDMLNMKEKMKLGGLFFVGRNMYVKANSQHMPDYEPNKHSNYIIYEEANNLNGVACQNIYFIKTSSSIMMSSLMPY